MILGNFDDWRDGKRMCPVSAEQMRRGTHFSQAVVQDAVIRFLEDGGEITKIFSPEHNLRSLSVGYADIKNTLMRGGTVKVEELPRSPNHDSTKLREWRNNQVSSGRDCP